MIKKLLMLEVLLVGVLAIPVAAQLDSAVMTVGYTAKSLDGERFGYAAPSFNVGKGSLSPDRFRHDGRTYTIGYIEWLSQRASLVLGVSPQMPGQFTLWLDGVEFTSSAVGASGAASGDHYYYQWFPFVGDWSEGDTVKVSVTFAPPRARGPGRRASGLAPAAGRCWCSQTAVCKPCDLIRRSS